eukprot:6288161-Amphidinium_carterae.2
MLVAAEVGTGWITATVTTKATSPWNVQCITGGMDESGHTTASLRSDSVFRFLIVKTFST